MPHDNTCVEQDGIDELNSKGLILDPPVKFEWGTYELHMKDPEGNEVVIAEFLHN